MRATTMAMILTLAAGTALAKPPLRDVAEIDDTLLAIGLADEIRKKCPDISGRMVKGFGLIMRLRDRALDLGYTEAEIDSYRKSKSEKARMRARGEAYVKARGVNQSKSEDWCALGRAEISRNSQIGALLRLN